MTDIAFTISGKDRSAAAFRSLEGNMAKTQKAISNFGGALQAAIGTLAIRQLGRFVTSQITVADTIAKAANVAGIAASELQELRFAFGQLANVTDKEVDLSLQRFNRRLGLAIDSAGPAKETFKALGISIRDAAGQIRPTSDILDEAIQKLALIPNDATRAARASEFFGDEAGPKLAAALQGGVDQVNALRMAINKDGGVIPDDAIKKAEELNDKFGQMKRVLDAKFATTVLDNAEAIDTLSAAIATLLGWTVQGVAGVTKFAKWIGEELAAKIHGVAVDDIPRLTQQLSFMEARLKSMIMWKNGEEQIAAYRKEVDKAREALERAQRVAARAPEIQPTVAIVRSSDPNFGKLPPKPVKAPGIKPTVTFSTDNAKAAEDKMREAQQIFDSLRTETEQIEAQIKRVQELAAEGFFKEGQDAELLERLQAQLDGLAEKTDESTQAISTAIEANLGGAIDELFASGELSAKSFFDALLRDIMRITIQLAVIKPLMEGLFGASAGGAAGSTGVLGGALKAMGFAKGGDFTVGGSGGPDSQFVPLRLSPGERVSIRTPSQQGGASIVINQTVDASGSDPVAVAQALRFTKEQTKAEIRDLMRRGKF